MEQINTKVKKWGNSLGIILPKKVVDNEDIEENSEVSITIQSIKKAKVKDIFGALKNWRINAQKFKDEIRKEESDE